LEKASEFFYKALKKGFIYKYNKKHLDDIYEKTISFRLDYPNYQKVENGDYDTY